MKYFLGEAATYDFAKTLRHLLAFGTKRDSLALTDFLAEHYGAAQVALTRNGRSALSLALRALLPKNSQVIINGLTCQAVVEAVIAAHCVPVYADINPATLHYDTKTLMQTLRRYPSAKAIIIQNTLGLPCDLTEPATSSGLPPLFTFAKRHNLIVIEDLAHCAGRRYVSGQECGSLGAAVALSFGKSKSIDTITGGAVLLRSEDAKLRPPTELPPAAETLRARLYPLFAGVARALTPSVLAKLWLGALLKLHLIERSADAKLDTASRLSHWQAKLALAECQSLFANLEKARPSASRPSPHLATHSKPHLTPRSSDRPLAPLPPLRDFRLVRDRERLLARLADADYFFSDIWYDCPVSPQRNYPKWHFPEAECPVATQLSQEIINLPTNYPEKSLAPALKIIAEYQK